MVRAFIRHRVRDYDEWRRVYDGFADVQREHGVRAAAVFRSVDDPNEVVVTHDFDDAGAARSFFALPALQEAMASSGVEGEPTIWLAEEV